MNTFLLLFLLVDVFIAGALSAVAVRHAYAHFKPPEPEVKKHVPMQNGHLPPSVREQLLAEAQANFQAVLDRSAGELRHDLSETTEQIKKLLDKQGAEAVKIELERYTAKLADLQKETLTDVGGLSEELRQHQADLKAKMAEEVAAEKQRLIDQIDTKLADAVASFLTETLQHNVDLGAQSAYLTATLEAHKADFTAKVRDEV
jgi:hypothetical protein